MKIKVIISGLVILILVSMTCLTTTVTTSTILKQGDSRAYYFKGNFGTTNATFNIDGTPSEILIHNGTTSLSLSAMSLKNLVSFPLPPNRPSTIKQQLVHFMIHTH